VGSQGCRRFGRHSDRCLGRWCLIRHCVAPPGGGDSWAPRSALGDLVCRRCLGRHGGGSTGNRVLRLSQQWVGHRGRRPVGRSDPGVVARGAWQDASIGSSRRDASIGIPEWNRVGTLLGGTDLAARSAGRGSSIGSPVWGILPGASIDTWRGASIGRLERAVFGTEGGSSGDHNWVARGHAEMSTRQVYTYQKLYC
jgi:hypothetical protein